MIMAVAVAGGLADLIRQCQIATVVWHNHLKAGLSAWGRARAII